MMPYGYEMQGGKIVPVLEEREKLIRFMEQVAEGTSIGAARRELGIPKSYPTCKRMLMDSRYLGTDQCPALVPEELFLQVQAALQRRANSGSDRVQQDQFPTVPTRFRLMKGSSAGPEEIYKRIRRHGQTKPRIREETRAAEAQLVCPMKVTNETECEREENSHVRENH